MRKHHLLIAVAWLMYVAAGVLPVYKHGVDLPEGLPGWDALAISFSPPFDALSGKRTETSLVLALLWAISGATNLLMIGTLWAPKLRRRFLNCFFWMAVGAAIINSNWCVFVPAFELRIGYFLWWLSFLILAAGIHSVLKAEGNEPGDHPSLVSGQS